MTAVPSPVTAATPTRTRLASPGRPGAWMAVLALPAWLSTFVALTLGYGLKSQEAAAFTPVEQASEYQSNLPFAWAFGVASVLAILLLTLTPILLGAAAWRLGRLRVPAAIVMLLGLVSLVVGLISALGYFGLIVAPPDALPGWAAALGESGTNTALNAIGWGAIDLAVPLVAVVLHRVRALGRSGLGIAIIGGAIFLVSALFLFFQPMVPAALLLVIGVPLLRHST